LYPNGCLPPRQQEFHDHLRTLIRVAMRVVDAKPRCQQRFFQNNECILVYLNRIDTTPLLCFNRIVLCLLSSNLSNEKRDIMGLDMSELPMPRKQEIYMLKHAIVNWQESTVEVSLSSKQRGLLFRRRIETITFNIVPGMTEQEAIRVATFVSPSKWIIGWMFSNSLDKELWNKPLDERLQAALADQPKISILLS
jgi:hypothetical protein